MDSGDTPTRTVRLSELFTVAGRPLVIYHPMYGNRQTKPCPMCTAWIDGFNGVAHHIAQNVVFAIVGAADSAALRAHARARGRDRLRLLSAGDSTFKYDLGSEDRWAKIRQKIEAKWRVYSLTNVVEDALQRL